MISLVDVKKNLKHWILIVLAALAMAAPFAAPLLHLPPAMGPQLATFSLAMIMVCSALFHEPPANLADLLTPAERDIICKLGMALGALLEIGPAVCGTSSIAMKILMWVGFAACFLSALGHTEPTVKVSQ